MSNLPTTRRKCCWSYVPWRSLTIWLFSCCEAKLNEAFEELLHYDLEDPNDFAEFLITANIGLVRAKLPRCIQFQKRTTRSVTVLLSICVHFKQMVIGCDWTIFSVGRSRSRFKHLILNDFDSFTSHHPNEFQCQVRNFQLREKISYHHYWPFDHVWPST